MAPPAKKIPKPVFKTSIPFTETRWPHLTSVDKDNILDLLCNLLQPLGDHRRTYIRPSRGKKRKRKSKQAPKKDANTANNLTTDLNLSVVNPQPPDIGNHVLVGLNNVTRHLEALAAQNAPSTLSASWSYRLNARTTSHDTENTTSPEDQDDEKVKVDIQAPRPLSLVIIPHSHPPASLPHAHIPTLVHLSTLSSSPSSSTRIIVVPPGCEPRLASALHIPHVGALGILEGAPGSKALEEYVREHVEVTECKWIDEAMKAEWKDVKLDTRKG